MTSVGTAASLVYWNILVYAYDTRDAAKRMRAIAILRQLRRRRVGTLSVQVMGEFFWNATRKIRPPLPEVRAERSVTNWTRSWPVFELTPAIVLEAIRGTQRHGLPYWDALIWATAKLNGVPTVLSEDFSDGSLIEGVRFLNPFRPALDPMTL